MALSNTGWGSFVVDRVVLLVAGLLPGFEVDTNISKDAIAPSPMDPPGMLNQGLSGVSIVGL